MPYRSQILSTIALVVALAGCHSPHNGGEDVADRAVPAPGRVALSQADPSSVTAEFATAGPHDAQPSPPILFRLECYQLKVPLGSVSRNEALWKRINEQCIDVATYDLLYKNGIRCGTAPWEEWHFVRDTIGRNVGTATKMASVGDQMENLPIELKNEVPYQTIFAFDQTNTPVGKSFDRCANFMNLSFQKVPRKPGHARISLAPVVRCERKRLEYTVLNDVMEFTLKQPETYYMNLVVDIPVGSFLVVSPSPEASWPTTVGHAFLVNDGAAEQFETVLIIAVQPMIDDPSRR